VIVGYGRSTAARVPRLVGFCWPRARLSKYSCCLANLLSILTLSDEKKVDGVTYDNILFFDKR
jgi:hypothetical protein